MEIVGGIIWLLSRWACSIADPASESVILTGGVETLETVSRHVISASMTPDDDNGDDDDDDPLGTESLDGWRTCRVSPRAGRVTAAGPTLTRPGTW